MQELLQWSNMGRKIFDPAMDTSRPTWRVARLWQGRGFAFAHCCGIKGCQMGGKRGCRLKKGLLIPIVARFWSAGGRKKTRRKRRVLIRMCRSSSSYDPSYNHQGSDFKLECAGAPSSHHMKCSNTSGQQAIRRPPSNSNPNSSSDFASRARNTWFFK